VIDELLGDNNTAIIGSDRYCAYGHLPLSRRQVCLAHLRRTFEDFTTRPGEAATTGQQLLAYTEQMFTWWHRVRDGTLQRASFQSPIVELQEGGVESFRQASTTKGRARIDPIEFRQQRAQSVELLFEGICQRHIQPPITHARRYGDTGVADEGYVHIATNPR
jgi:hypothetical protein